MKKGLIIAILLLLAFLLFGCSSESKTATTSKEDVVENVSLEKPVAVNKDKGTVTILGTVNGKYFTENTRHGAVNGEGSNGSKSVFKTYGNVEDFYNGLIEIGAQPGNNVPLENKATEHVSGDPLDVTVSWVEGTSVKTVSIDEAIKDSNGEKFDIRFGGNLATAKDKKTGCIMCLDSCPVGITSNAVYTYGAVEDKKEVAFKGNEAVFPDDGTSLSLGVLIKNRLNKARSIK